MSSRVRVYADDWGRIRLDGWFAGFWRTLAVLTQDEAAQLGRDLADLVAACTDQT